jgi:hypothetical protein
MSSHTYRNRYRILNDNEVATSSSEGAASSNVHPAYRGPRRGEIVWFKERQSEAEVMEIDYDRTWGPQIKIRFVCPSFPDNPPVYDDRWVMIDDISKIRNKY